MLGSEGIRRFGVREDGLYRPLAGFSDGAGYTIDSGSSIITEDADGLLVEMTASTSFEVTLTAIDPPAGAHFLLQALHLWLTISAPTAPAAGDKLFVRSESSATEYSEAALHYDGAAWELLASRVVGGVYASAAQNLAGTLEGERIFGAQWSASVVTNARVIRPEFYTAAAGVGATGEGNLVQLLNTVEDVSLPANTQTIRVGGEVGAGSSWSVRLHGFRAVEHVVNAPGAPFPL